MTNEKNSGVFRNMDGHQRALSCRYVSVSSVEFVFVVYGPLLLHLPVLYLETLRLPAMIIAVKFTCL